MRRASVQMLLFPIFCLLIACGSGGGDNPDRESQVDYEDDNLLDDDYEQDAEACVGDEECWPRNYFSHNFCWELVGSIDCPGACFIVGVWPFNKNGICVDECTSSSDCPEGFFCQPVCGPYYHPDDSRWCTPDYWKSEFEC